MSGEWGEFTVPGEIGVAPAAVNEERRVFFGVAAMLAAVTVILLAIFHAAGWYADNVLLSRYCDAPAASLALVERILTDPRPAGNNATEPYVIAAKLIYLVPRQPSETVPVYLARLNGEIAARCH